MSSFDNTKYSSDHLWRLCKEDDHGAFKQLFDNEFEKLLAYGQKIDMLL